MRWSNVKLCNRVPDVFYLHNSQISCRAKTYKIIRNNENASMTNGLKVFTCFACEIITLGENATIPTILQIQNGVPNMIIYYDIS